MLNITVINAWVAAVYHDLRKFELEYIRADRSSVCSNVEPAFTYTVVAFTVSYRIIVYIIQSKDFAYKNYEEAAATRLNF